MSRLSPPLSPLAVIHCPLAHSLSFTVKSDSVGVQRSKGSSSLSHRNIIDAQFLNTAIHIVKRSALCVRGKNGND